ncbi:MAG TPA: DUF4136 domain-containing protein [Bryobacteraceae bacterium]|nr:DUF4136 domain-containing protein [Bryobacteraceae bacterium]
MSNPRTSSRTFLWGTGLIAAMIIGTSCAGRIHVATDYSHATNFANYHTYSWLKVSAGNQLWASRIRRDVNAQLLAKGWTEMPGGGQAAVTAFGSTHEQPTLETFYDSFGPGFGGWGWRGWGGPGFGYATTQTIYTPVGTLVVDIFNAANKHLIWRGVARQALSGNPQKNEPKLAHAVNDMFKSFPPGERG